ncbi:MAG: hypothetical protein GC178_11070 [Flavobacteriales bacterium]|nr:hypothetical protein [Flavobacteriales bacterium]
MKHRIVFFILNLVGLTIVAQERTFESDAADVYMSEQQKRDPELTMKSFVSAQKSQVILEMGGRDGLSYVTFDKTLGVVEVKKGMSEELGRVFSSQKGDPDPMRFDFANRQFCLKGITDFDERTNHVILYEIDMLEQTILSTEEIGKLEGDEFLKEFRFSALDWNLSPDGSKLVILYKLPETKDDKGNTIYKFNFIVYDS